MNITTLSSGETATEPGLYRMTAEQYFADPCPAPSLSSSTIRRMLQWTPAHAAAFHPRIGGVFDAVWFVVGRSHGRWFGVARFGRFAARLALLCSAFGTDDTWAG